MYGAAIDDAAGFEHRPDLPPQAEREVGGVDERQRPDRDVAIAAAAGRQIGEQAGRVPPADRALDAVALERGDDVAGSDR